MNNVKEQSSWIKKFRNTTYYLMLTFTEDGCEIHRFSYNNLTKKISELKSFFLSNINEKNISENKILKTILKLVYFPFPYVLLLNIPHQFCQSRYDSVSILRSKPNDSLTVQELNSFFTHAVWKLVEKNKKLFMARHSYDDINTLLAHNSLSSAFIGKRDILNEPEDTVISQNGKDIRVGIVQTYLYRPVFTQLSKIIPKRVRIHSVLENGFSVAKNIQNSFQKSDKDKNNRAMLCIVDRNKTHVFLVSNDEILHSGSFHFGTHSTYEACNNLLGIGMESYQEILNRCMKNNLSSHAQKFIEKIIYDEISRLEKGIESFKKELKVKNVYVEAGSLNHFISLQKKFPAKIVEKEDVNPSIYIHGKVDWDIYAITVAQYAVPLREKTFTKTIIQKLFRWIMPNIIE